MTSGGHLPPEQDRTALLLMLDEVRRDFHETRTETGLDVPGPALEAALSAVPRHRFVPDDLAPAAYENRALPIGHGQTISQPFIVALMTALLDVGPDASVLEIGTGSGYQCAVLSRMVRQVYTVEMIEGLACAAGERFHEPGFRNIDQRVGNGRDGWPEKAPFDGILVTAGAPDVPPALVEQLRPGGRLVIPVGRSGWGQTLTVIEKRPDGTTGTREIMPVAFVPLVS